MPDISAAVKKYDRKLWEYSIRIGQKMVLFDNCYSWDIERVYCIFVGEEKG